MKSTNSQRLIKLTKTITSAIMLAQLRKLSVAQRFEVAQLLLSTAREIFASGEALCGRIAYSNPRN